ncbi:20888_t:CDS:1, partial [Dentiscutata erythropus]
QATTKRSNEQKTSEKTKKASAYEQKKKTPVEDNKLKEYQ